MAHFGTRITFEKQGVSDKNSFDLGRLDTYYTRPMSPPWSKPLEVDRLADGGADVDFAIPLAELSGLRSMRAGVAGSVHGRAHFTRQRGLAVAELALAGEATLRVPALHAADAAAAAIRGCGWRWSTTEAEAARVPEDLEPMLAPGGRISIGGAHHGGVVAEPAHRAAARGRGAVRVGAGAAAGEGSAGGDAQAVCAAGGAVETLRIRIR